MKGLWRTISNGPNGAPKSREGLFLKGRPRDLYLMLSRQRSRFDRVWHSADSYFEHTWARLRDEVVDERAW